MWQTAFDASFTCILLFLSPTQKRLPSPNSKNPNPPLPSAMPSQGRYCRKAAINTTNPSSSHRTTTTMSNHSLLSRVSTASIIRSHKQPPSRHEFRARASSCVSHPSSSFT
ncbi:hypothetical protein VIGAN_01446400 [Vigna angularis var. angularis]|uniref:Uncharacterized protein n=1 Tax=Vigna angularis var. angularis TaxID=157739 RepID=A0A0S3R7L4_PHAAN|nr:hypothetical protein VIGAN_01446400 [Vigna angularis var. angularis]